VDTPDDRAFPVREMVYRVRWEGFSVPNTDGLRKESANRGSPPSWVNSGTGA
jgi:hypothetical protein